MISFDGLLYQFLQVRAIDESLDYGVGDELGHVGVGVGVEGGLDGCQLDVWCAPLCRLLGKVVGLSWYRLEKFGILQDIE